MDKLYGDNVYIPIWLDLLSRGKRDNPDLNVCLHSNMVRFIINL